MTEVLLLQDQLFAKAFGHIRHNMQVLYLYLEGVLLLALANGNKDSTQQEKESPSCPPGMQSQNEAVTFCTTIIACVAMYLPNSN